MEGKKYSNRAGGKILIRAFALKNYKYAEVYKKSPKERYIEVINRNPDILQKATSRDIASFLLVTPTRLSRIRNEFKG